ncbi:RCC1 repeat-containing protein, partial [Myxococcota bacterium]|nr:RCC1 repeat-containing protein [Myxococcota bacterium]
TSAHTPATVDVSVSGPLSDLVGGVNFFCGLTSLGAAWCWGDNYLGQLGTGDNIQADSPAAVLVDGLTFSSLAASRETACGVDADGLAWCWGDNSNDQLGVGALHGVPSSNEPVAVDMPDGATFDQISIGSYHACAKSSDYNAWCWGNNDFGQLGIDSPSSRFAPDAVQ